MKLTFKNITSTSESNDIFHILMKDYAKELDEHQNRTTDPAILEKWTDSIIAKSKNDKSRILKLCYADDEAIGFLVAKIDQPNDKGYIRVGYGYIMELYVIPMQRRKGYGKTMLKHIEQFFREQGVTQMYLTSDPVTGKPFWSALGFKSRGELSPDNGQEIFEKILFQNAAYYAQEANVKEAEHISMLYNKNINALHGAEITAQEWRDALAEKDEDETHFLIYKDATPVAWLKINGLRDNNTCWISMLAVEPIFHRQGIGTFAIGFAEEYCRSLGKKQLFVKTTEDNIAAQKLYSICSFAVCDKVMYSTGDGISRVGIVYSKLI